MLSLVYIAQNYYIDIGNSPRNDEPINLLIPTWKTKQHKSFKMDGWMFGEFQAVFLYKDLVHHPIETTIYK